MPCERKQIQDGIDALQMWLDMGDCECETATHTCGKPKIERALAGLQKALAACDESPWRSMESAPRDGTDIILFVDGEAHEGGWLTGEAQGAPSERYAGWWCVTGTADEEPTHWMPLPAAPEVKP